MARTRLVRGMTGLRFRRKPMRNVPSIAAAALAGAVLVGGAVAVQTRPAEAGASTGTWKYGVPYRGDRGGYAYRGGGYGYRPYRRYGGGAVAAGVATGLALGAALLRLSGLRRRPGLRRRLLPRRPARLRCLGQPGHSARAGLRLTPAPLEATERARPRRFLVWVFRFLQNFRKLRAEGWGAAHCCGPGPRKPCPVHAAVGLFFSARALCGT